MPKLTKRTAEAFSVPADAREAFLWDDEVPGFGLRAHATGGRTFVIQYRAGGRTRRYALGTFGRLTVEQARTKAKALLAGVDTEGRDPSAERRAERQAETVAELAARYLTQHAEPKKKARSIAEDRRILERYVLPKLGRHKIADVERVDVINLHHAMRATPIMANRVVALVSKLFNVAERWGLRPDNSNPCRHVERYAETRRERYLTREELARLGATLADLEREGAVWPTIPAFVRLLLFTGARHDEIRTLRWEHVDLESGALRLPDSKTGAKVIALSAPAREVLATVPRVEANPFVIYGARPGRPLVNVKKFWRAIVARAELGDLRPHDLRHSFASEAVSGGATLPMIGALLGHTQAATTARYAHLYRDPIVEAADRIGGRLAAAMEPAITTASVMELKRKRA